MVESDERAAHAFNNERTRWLRFAYKQPEAKGLGDHIVTEMVRRGGVLGNSEALEELKSVLVEVRRSGRASAPPLSQQMCIVEKSSQATAVKQTLVPSSASPYDGRPAQAESFDAKLWEHWLGIEQAGGGEGFYAIMRRYRNARVQEEYKRRIAIVTDPERDPPLPLEDIDDELPDSDMATEDLFSLVIPSPERALEQNADCTSASSRPHHLSGARRLPTPKRNTAFPVVSRERSGPIAAFLAIVARRAAAARCTARSSHLPAGRRLLLPSLSPA
jgi:hypothetical protein